MTTSDTNNVAYHFPCRRCKYDLFMQARGGVCPECGDAVDASYRDDLLYFAEPSWLASVKGGLDLLYWVMIVGIAMGIGFLALVYTIATTPAAPIAELLCLIVIFSLVLIIAFLIGVFRITALEPGLSDTKMRNGWRLTARVAIFVAFFPQIQTMGMQTPGILNLIFAMIAQLAQMVFLFALLTYAHTPAERIPDERLARGTVIVKYGFVVLWALGTILAIVAFALNTAGQMQTFQVGVRSSNPLLVVAGCATGLFTLVLILWLVRILTHFRRALKHILPIAKANHTETVSTVGLGGSGGG